VFRFSIQQPVEVDSPSGALALTPGCGFKDVARRKVVSLALLGFAQRGPPLASPVLAGQGLAGRRAAREWCWPAAAMTTVSWSWCWANQVRSSAPTGLPPEAYRAQPARGRRSRVEPWSLAPGRVCPWKRPEARGVDRAAIAFRTTAGPNCTLASEDWSAAEVTNDQPRIGPLATGRAVRLDNGFGCPLPEAINRWGMPS